MFQRCRPAGRLFYLVLAVVVSTWSVRVSAREEASASEGRKCRQLPQRRSRLRQNLCRGRLRRPPKAAPTLTSVVDTVYMANGSAGAGDSGDYVAGVCDRRTGRRLLPGLNVTLGANGALNVELVVKCGSDACKRVLHGGLPAWTGRSKNRILGGADKFSGDSGAGADDAGIGDGGSTGVDAVRKHGVGGEGE